MTKFDKIAVTLGILMLLAWIAMSVYSIKLDKDIEQTEIQKNELLQEIINLEEVRQSGESERLK